MLSKRAGGEMIVRRLKLPPPGEETFFIWGPRQTGKSTLLRARCGGGTPICLAAGPSVTNSMVLSPLSWGISGNLSGCSTMGICPVSTSAPTPKKIERLRGRLPEGGDRGGGGGSQLAGFFQFSQYWAFRSEPGTGGRPSSSRKPLCLAAAAWISSSIETSSRCTSARLISGSGSAVLT